jgi:hypothetical protein
LFREIGFEKYKIIVEKIIVDEYMKKILIKTDMKLSVLRFIKKIRKVLRTRKIIIMIADAGLTEIEIADPIDVNTMPIK